MENINRRVAEVVGWKPNVAITTPLPAPDCWYHTPGQMLANANSSVPYPDYAGDLNLAMDAAVKVLKIYNPTDCVSLNVFYDNSATCKIRYTENDILCGVEGGGETPAAALCAAILARERGS